MSLKLNIFSYFTFWKKIINSKDGKTLLSNFTWLSALEVAGYIFPLLTYPYLARVIGVDGFGKLAFAFSIVVWFQTITGWGFNYTATRDVSRIRNDKERVNEIFSDVLWARCFLVLLSFIVLSILIWVVPKFKENALVIYMTFLMIPGHILFPEWFFQAMERMKFLTIFNVCIKFFFTVSIFVFIKDQKDFILQPLFTSLGYVVCGIVSLYVILFRWGYHVNKPSIKRIWDTIKYSTDVFLNNIMPNFYNNFSVLLLGFCGGSVANGILDAGTKFINICNQFLSVLSRTFYPFLSRRIDQHSMYAKFSISLSVLASVSLFFFAPFLIKVFFSESFSNSIIVLRIMSISLLFLNISNVYGVGYLILQKKEKKLRNITAFSSLLGIVISVPLIIFWGYIGAAITITITRGLLGVWSMIAALTIKRHLNVKGYVQ